MMETFISEAGCRTMTLTEWCGVLTSCLVELKKRFPSATFHDHTVFNAVSQIATHGAILESYGDNISGLLETRTTSNAMLHEEKKLGKKIRGIGRTPNYLPKIIVPIDALIAVAYYEHLERYRHVVSSRSILNDGNWLNPGVQARKAIVDQHAKTLKDDILHFLELNQNVEGLLSIHSGFVRLSTLTDPHQKFTLFSDLALGRDDLIATGHDTKGHASLIQCSEKTFEEKLGDCLAHQFLIAVAEPNRANARVRLSQHLDETIVALDAIRTCKEMLDVVANSAEVSTDGVVFERFYRLCSPHGKGVVEAFELHLANKKILKRPMSVYRAQPPVDNIPVLFSSSNKGSISLRGWATSGAKAVFSRTGLTTEYAKAQPATGHLPVERYQEEPPVRNAMRDMTNRMLDCHVQKLNLNAAIKFEFCDIKTRTTQDLEHLIKKSQLLVSILKVGEAMSEFTETHHTWFTRKLHRLFTLFREQDSKFLKTFFVPDKWKFIYEAKKLESEMTVLKKKLRTDPLVEVGVVEKEFKAKLDSTRGTILSIQRESLFFLRDAKVLQATLEKKIDEGYSGRDP